jgi:hypothetical protein
MMIRNCALIHNFSCSTFIIGTKPSARAGNTRADSPTGNFYAVRSGPSIARRTAGAVGAGRGCDSAPHVTVRHRCQVLDSIAPFSG